MKTLLIPKLTNKNAALWGYATGAIVLGYAAYVAVTQPENRIFTLFAPLLVAGIAALVLRDKSYIEQSESDRILVHRQLFATKRASILRGDSVAIVKNNAGGLLFAAKQGKQTAYAMLFMKSSYFPNGITQSTAIYDALVESCGMSSAAGAAEVCEALQNQKQYMAEGGALADSPLAKIATNPIQSASSLSAYAVLIGQL